MPDDPEIIEEDEPPSQGTEEASALLAKFALLKYRCEQAGIEFALKDTGEGTQYATLVIKAGRTDRKLHVFTKSRADSLLKVPFEKYRFLSGYEAICSYEEKTIEGVLRTTRLGAMSLLAKIQGERIPLVRHMKTVQIASPTSSPHRPVIEIGRPSPELEALVGSRLVRVSIKLRGARATQHDQAVAELRSYADSIFFQIDLAFGSTFILERERRGRFLSPGRLLTGFQIAYPTAHFNEEAMSLYWYAKSAPTMPLLRFLAFYQSIEFYFPRYSQYEARRRVGNIVKQPTFRPHRDDDLDRLISAIQISRVGGLGNEREQLRSAVNECMSAGDVREYLTSSDELGAHFSGKGGKAKYHKVPIANKTADLRNDVADRIYDIRCKIVHTKNDPLIDEVPMILPFSEDAEYLLFDIDLVEFVARKVLIASSSELQ